MKPVWVLCAVGLLLLISCFASLMVGAQPIAPRTVLAAWLQPDATQIEHILVQTTRLARTLMALTVGASLAVAGVLMQAMTRNPLASPGLFGVNAGAIFFIVLSSVWLGAASLATLVWAGFLGAALAGGVVFGIGSLGRGATSPVRILLAGAAITALFLSFTQAMLVINQDGLDSVLFWLAGSVAGRESDLLMPLLPYVVVGLVFSRVLAPHINILVAGDDVARGLGLRTGWIRGLMGVCVIALAGSAVAIAGNIGFIGLIVPHMARRLCSHDHRWLIPTSALLGACLLLWADMVARIAILPQELPLGVMTAVLGAPYFIALVRREARHG
ncbi:FecCD family ABC transporter permease [Candidatus Symbiopectobacterium sp. NZEC135]|uniref:FecCD family ABC transporter permease n=1 Tax=Candidatus Symbiopectobacterium sp. NZEC135 TaxID=2820471 RepID=UPI002226FC9C|nr:iron ABC transporter permease [Candidatus Symbiopectobacterium sp. NZEC135]MCW2479774.1 iron ABC transporter permease [Candidatus Symbiopectobacterium sp. NZEC135]